MLPLNNFSLVAPKDLEELLSVLSQANERTKIMAGGTDLLPNLKHGLYEIDTIVSLRNVRELSYISLHNQTLTIGSGVTLKELIFDPRITSLVPAVGKASSQIASPQIRNMGTVGGNICLDTRCLYFNQSEFWRSALGYCLKKDGVCCHVVKTGKRCVAAASNDLATILLGYDATLTIASKNNNKAIKLHDFYTSHGEKNNILSPEHMVTAVSIDISRPRYSGFFKLRHRNSIDFALLSVAVALELDQRRCLVEGSVVLNAIVAKPKVMDLAEFKGAPYNRTLIENIAHFAERKCFPQTNIGDDPLWRKNMCTYAVQQACCDAIFPRD